MKKYFDLMKHNFISPLTNNEYRIHALPSYEFQGYHIIEIDGLPSTGICSYMCMDAEAFNNFLKCNGIYAKLINPSRKLCVKFEDFPVLESVINRKLNSIYASDSEKSVSLNKIQIQFE